MTATLPPAPTYDPTQAGSKPDEGPLRIGGVQLTGIPGLEKDLPSTPSPRVKAQQADLAMVRDLAAGPGRMRDAKTTYLPQAPAEDTKNYQNRLQRSVYFNYFLKTVKGLAGFIFRKDPDLGDDVPEVIAKHCENIDLAGTHIDVFARETLEDALTAGHSAILVEYPNTGGRPLTLEDEQWLRPYWVPIKKDNIISFRTTIEDGRQVLTQIVLREASYVEDGDFAEKLQTRYRRLFRLRVGDQVVVGFQLLQINDNKAVEIVDAGFYRNQLEIPIAEIITSGRKGMFESDPPLIDLAFLNVAHYQVWSDYVTSLHMTCVPILFTAGFEMQDENGVAIVVGANTGLNAPDPQAKAEYVSHAGAAIGAVRQALADLKDDMASLGIAMLSAQKKMAETAEAKRIGKSDTDSALSVTARGLQDGIERALGFHARYLGIDDGGSIQINRDFENLQMQADMLGALVTAVHTAGLPVRLLLEQMQEGGLISPEHDLDELTMEMMANAQAAAEQQAAEAAARANILQGTGGEGGGSTGTASGGSQSGQGSGNDTGGGIDQGHGAAAGA